MKSAYAIILAAFMVSCFAGWLAGAYPRAELIIPESDIIFSHNTHVAGADIECLTCHAAAEGSNQAADNLLPSMDDCGNCHNVSTDTLCGTCHRNADEPSGLPNPERPILFDHARHLRDKIACLACHDDIGKSDKPDAVNLPRMKICIDCHSQKSIDDRCRLCHGDRISLTDIHPLNWRHSHGDEAASDRDWCGQCHRVETFCIDCHRGDNILGNIHDLNYAFTHGLDANSKEADCTACHDRESFCRGCHEGENRIPLLHSTLSWLADHGRAARNDIENCASCHEGDSPTCARGGCHRDSDGLRGTDPRFHPGGLSLLESHGPWHGDAGYYCYQCHIRTDIPGVGFCGYCHE